MFDPRCLLTRAAKVRTPRTLCSLLHQMLTMRVSRIIGIMADTWWTPPGEHALGLRQDDGLSADQVGGELSGLAGAVTELTWTSARQMTIKKRSGVLFRGGTLGRPLPDPRAAAARCRAFGRKLGHGVRISR